MVYLLTATALLCIAYDITLISLNPGTLLDNIFSFKHIWSALGICLIFLAAYRKRTGRSFWQSLSRRIKIITGSVLSVCVVIAAVNLCFILTPQIAPITEDADYVILLGGGISEDGILPNTVMKRVEKAAEYLNAHPKAICVVTGGTLNWLPYAEAPEMKRQLVLAGVEEQRVLVEDQALDTIQNLQLSCKLLSGAQHVPQREVLESHVVIVTSRFHLRRAERLARRMGYTSVAGIPTKCPLINIPHCYVKEICSYIKLNLRILQTGKPARIEE